MEDLRIDSHTLNTVYGLPRSVKTTSDVVMALLGAKTSLSTCNFELALLLSGFKALEITRIKIARISFAVLFERFLRV
ncbi:hypothetical protein PR001_g24741 [Phytophthora rubi]|uniref:Uncharacterized protein n=1 Tax=Phytophthora rubi TaxID=129364 RepID=A0A6A3I760_9STRA|nr:hypothetical protein PR001_g24741 [Phytophthora rubi]